MREIKFRAWDIAKKTMHECLWVGIYECQIMVPNEGRMFDDRKVLNIVDTPMGPKQAELMQYTGRKDKNGREIYEGDVVASPDFPAPGPITYNSDFLQFVAGDWVGMWRIPGTAKDIEVLGNIYEHPELCAAPAAGDGE
jgi:uncharacterized phage protein (TIGR01671 family)